MLMLRCHGLVIYEQFCVTSRFDVRGRPLEGHSGV